MRFFDELNVDGILDGLDIQKEELLEILGLGHIDRDLEFRYISLEDSQPYELYDVMVKCVRFEEYVNETLARAEKRKKDSELEKSKIRNQIVANLVANKVKPTEAKSIADSDERLVDATLRYNVIDTYCDYLKRFVDTLEKFHYVVKMRVQNIVDNQKKVIQ